MDSIENTGSTATSALSGSNETAVSSKYKWYVLGVLTLVYMLSVADRNIFAILLPHIQADLALTDTQMGMLSGVAFGLFYATLGLPIAVWADRSNRRNIVAGALGIFSLMTAVCGLAGNFIQMLFARMGVGIGEAGTSPPSHSILSDYFPAGGRSLAMGILTMGAFFGMLLGFVVGGAIEEQYGWRAALYALGIPGIFLSLVTWLTVKEPERGASEEFVKKAPSVIPRLSDVLSFLWQQKSYCFAVLAFSIGAFVAYALITWMPTYLVREFQMESSVIGKQLGLALFISGILGAGLSAYLVGRMVKRDSRWVLWLPAIVVAMATPSSVYMFVTDNGGVAIACFYGVGFLLAFAQPAIIVVAQNQVPVRMRTVSSATLFFASSLFGIGFGPMAAGIISDLLIPLFGNESLKYSLMAIAPTLIIAALMMVLGARSYIADEDRIKAGA